MINIKFKMKITIAVIAILVLLSVSAFRTKNTMHSKVKELGDLNWCNGELQTRGASSSFCSLCYTWAPDYFIDQCEPCAILLGYTSWDEPCGY